MDQNRSNATAPATDAVTGAFSYSGRHISERLLRKGRRVRTLTNHPRGSSLLDQPVPAFPLDFEHPQKLVEALRGVDTLYTTYWVRFSHGKQDFEGAVRNTGVLVAAAASAGVRRLVQVSIANPSEHSDLGYYRGKAAVEAVVRSSELSYAIVRPTVMFGHGDVLINNIAWMLRHLPLFGIAGDGSYEIQPVFVEDFADFMVEVGGRRDNVVMDAVGPDVFAFEELVRLMRTRLNSRAMLVHLPPALTLLGSSLTGALVRDVVLTREELKGLMDGLLVSTEPATCPTSLRQWLEANASNLGRSYSSELGRHFR
jgi:NADH dehydrogenase